MDDEGKSTKTGTRVLILLTGLALCAIPLIGFLVGPGVVIWAFAKDTDDLP